MAPTLMEHQVKALARMHNGCVLTGGVGTGKTITSLFYAVEKVMGGVVGDYGSLKTPKDIYVFTTARKRDTLDWQQQAAKMAIGREAAASIGGITLTVDSYNNIGKYTAVHGAFIILDEQRMVGSGAWTKAFLHMAKSNEWIMLSATPADVWEDYIALFIANGFYKNRTQFKREHCVYSYYGKFPKLERYTNVGKLVKLRNSILVDMPYQRHTIRHLHETLVQYDEDLYKKVVKDRWHVYEERPLADAAELFAVMRKVANTDISRLNAVWDLSLKHPRMIIFYNFNYELDALRELFRPLVEEQEKSTSGLTTSSSSPRPTTMGVQPDTLRSASTTTSSPKRKQDKSSVSTGSPRTASKLSSTATSSQTLKMSQLSSASPSSTSEKTSSTSRGPSQIGSENSSLEIPSPTSSAEASTTTPRPGFALAEWNGHKHEEVPETERWIYLVQYVAGAEAWNCTSTDCVVFYSLTYSYKNFEQAQGRIDRLDTPYKDLHYYVLAGKSSIDRAVMKALKGKKSFNEKDFGG
jgi:hypothetical protein